MIASLDRIQHGGMMLFANFPQMAVAAEHLGAAQ
jgi:hypothetical protein